MSTPDHAPQGDGRAGAIVVINAGSSSIKFAAFSDSPPGCTGTSAAPAALQRLLHGKIQSLGSPSRIPASMSAWDGNGQPLTAMPEVTRVAQDNPHEAVDDHYARTVRSLWQWLGQQLPGHTVRCVAHRVVHGGEHLSAPALVTPALLEQLHALIPLAPLHQPHNLAAITALAAVDSTLVQVACFDTAFHAGQDWVEQAYALPQHIRDAGVRRYGFHGLSYEYIASQLPAHLGAQAGGRVVVAHLGNGASMCALHHGRSVATSMGFTALDGLMMGTRCGSLDPGVVLYMARQMHMGIDEIEHLLYHDSGLLGISQIDSDMRVLQASDDPRAAAAIDLFVHRIHRELGALAAVLGGLDALVLTAGIGEHSSAIRQRVCANAAWLGLQTSASPQPSPTGCLSAPGSRVSAWVIPTNEELMLAQHAHTVLAAQATQGRA